MSLTSTKQPPVPPDKKARRPALKLSPRAVRYFRRLAVVVFVAAVPVFLVTTNVRWVINAPVLYSYGFDRYDIPAYTGIERSELLLAARQIRDYFSNGEEFLDVRVVVRGIRRSIYNEREVLHMRDVKGLVKGVYRVQEATGAYLAVFAAVGLALYRRRFAAPLVRYLSLGGGATLALAAIVGLGAVVGFDRLFLAFHLVSFSNDLWQLDPSRDYLIAMFPQGFFFDATMWIAGFTVAQALLLALAAPVLLWWRPWTGLRTAHGIPARDPVPSERT